MGAGTGWWSGHVAAPVIPNGELARWHRDSSDVGHGLAFGGLTDDVYLQGGDRRHSDKPAANLAPSHP